MSQEALNEFLQKVNADDDLRRAFEARFDDPGEIPSKDLIAFADEQGYDFTVDEAKELSDAELEGVAGGTLFDDQHKVYYDTDTTLTYDVSYDLQSDSFNFLKIE